MTVTRANLKVLKALQEYYREQEARNLYPIIPPSYRQLCFLAGVRSTSVIVFHIEKLLEEGLVVRGHNRAVYLTEEGLNYGTTDQTTVA